MEKKKIFVTAMEHDEALVKSVFNKVSSYGFDVNGHLWNYEEQDLTKEIPSVELETSSAWIIIASNKIEEKAMIGLSLTILTLKNFSKTRVPILVIGPSQELPPILQYAEFCDIGNIGAKLAAKTAIKKPWPKEEFRYCAHNQTGVGFWLEIGPAADSWNGVLCGVSTDYGASLDFQAVGDKGMLPERSTLNYPFKDAKLSNNNVEYVANGCKNVLTSNDSYFVRLKGIGTSIIIGEGLADDDSMECYTIKLAV